MQFTSASAVEQVTWEMRLADYPRGLNRSKINDLANGVPPYTDTEVRQNNIATNVNFLELTKILHDARRQFANAFLVPDPLFSVALDSGPAYKRLEWAATITKEINKRLRRSLPYLETRRSVFANTVNHGIGPAHWDDALAPLPDAMGVEDVLVPSNTLLTMKNLPFFAIYRQYTPAWLWKLTHKPVVDPGWNMPLVDQVIEWADQEAQKLMSASWPEVWSPEKMSERIKGDGGLYASDAVPTIDCFDFYFWSDEKKKTGWRRRVILDAWGSPGAGGVAVQGQKPELGNRRFDWSANQFLYNSGSRVFADDIKKIIHWQFGDASAVAPFRYHSVRSLGFLLYSVCHLQNRLRCKFNDSVFESLLQYFRIADPADRDRLTKIDLIDKGIVPEGLAFVRPEERWQIQGDIVTSLMQLNRQTMSDNSASFTQDFDFEREKSEETATRTMAKVNATAALVGSMLHQAYEYQTFQYAEICRRFCIERSQHTEVKAFRKACLADGIPEELLDSDRWEIIPNRVIGTGNKMLQVAIADKLMGIRSVIEPNGQKEIDRLFISANTDDYSLANALVPESKPTSDSTHDAELSAAAMLSGLPMQLKEGVNHREYIDALLRSMQAAIHRIESKGGMATLEEITGLQLLAGQDTQGQPIEGNGVADHIEILSQDKAEAQNVKIYGDTLAKMLNMVRAYAQRLQEQQQKQAQAAGGNGGLDPKDAAKIQAMLLQAKTKADLAAKSHAQRTAQRQVQFEQEMRQREDEHAMQTQHDLREHGAELMKTGAEAEEGMRLNRLRSLGGE